MSIELLYAQGIKPESLTPIPLLVEHWLWLNKKSTLEETWKAFAQEFKHLDKIESCY